MGAVDVHLVIPSTAPTTTPVVAPPSNAPARPELPLTGIEIGLAVLVAVLLLVAGALLLRSARRRPATT